MTDKTSSRLCGEETVCTGCGACIVACMDQNDTCIEAGEPPLRRLRAVQGPSGQGNPSVCYVSESCRHCAGSPCVSACPHGAMTRDPDTGCVTVEAGRCRGCGLCIKACPYSVPKLGPGGRVYKCDGCNERRKAGLLPACVKVCPVGAIKRW